MKWRAVAGFSDPQMVQHAARRARVRLDDGTIVRLVGWPGGSHARRTGRYCRLQTSTGNMFSLHVRRIVEVDLSDDA